MMANENEFVKLQTGLINAATDDSDMAKAFIADSIKQLSAYLESYDVHNRLCGSHRPSACTGSAV